VERGHGSGLEGVGAAGSGAPRKGDLRLPGAAEETDDVRRQTASGAWAGTAHLLERRYSVDGEAWHYRPGAVCGRFILTLSAPTAGTAVSWAPSRLLAGFFPPEAWRNSDHV